MDVNFQYILFIDKHWKLWIIKMILKIINININIDLKMNMLHNCLKYTGNREILIFHELNKLYKGLKVR